MKAKSNKSKIGASHVKQVVKNIFSATRNIYGVTGNKASRGKLINIALLAAYIVFSISLLVPSFKALTPIDEDYKNIYGTTVGHDFKIFYLSGKMASEEKFASLYDVEKFNPLWHEYYNSSQLDVMNFNYPPTALPLWHALSGLSYLQAFSLWVLVPFLATSLVIFMLTRSWWVLSLTLISPLFIRSILVGQVNLLATAIVGLGLLAYHKKKPVAAGLIFGLLVIKPHLALALPFCFLATRDWKVIAGGMISLCGGVLVSLILYGPEAWTIYFDNVFINGTPQVLTQEVPTYRTITIWENIMVLTGNLNLSVFIHGLGMVFGVGSCIYIWKKTTNYVPQLMAIILTPGFIMPYFMTYDLTPLVLVFAIALADFITQNRSGRSTIIALIILVLGLAIFKSVIHIYYLGPVFTTLLMVYALVLSREEEWAVGLLDNKPVEARVSDG